MKTTIGALVLALTLFGTAQAGQQAMVPCPQLHDGCVVTCVNLEILTSYYDPSAAPLLVELLDASGATLATAELQALSQNQRRANLDNRVLGAEIDSIRLYSDSDAVKHIGWGLLQVLCDPCACACWTTVYKGCLCDWRPTPVALIEPMPEPEYIIELPEQEFYIEPEVVVVPGRG